MIGKVIKNQEGYRVILQTENGSVTLTERLEDFISRNAVIAPEDIGKTFREVIEGRCSMYLNSGIKIIEE
ncbi:hypothetical protein ABE073_04560 [Lederbergia citrisecunda]|uniref:hypothetical protein n=1 Tax=Lederbergia citrisecunda TaxID=2833583 RepID=UPI003D2DCA67